MASPWGDVVTGAVLIGVGLFLGGSVFAGNPGMLGWVFDGLGVFWIIKGVYGLTRAASDPTAMAGE